ncbi:MAG: hypothetical protein KKF30_13145 [Proteobacteria bacterium]|nr:hypothetical protein [Pseudomonadota bacterium]MBU4470687.1 hypothetical protein [Pseudomonadota bacterium]MCG2751217.1 hypothetical protein [Desulfobacteraceae bacterium]
MKTEKQTRIELIDAALEAAGWNVGEPSHVVQEYDIVVDPSRVAEAVTPYGGRQFSDYVLLGRDRKPLAVVEALVLDLTRSNPILQKLKSGAGISTTEADALADLLNKTNPHITENLLRMVYQNCKAHFVQFIRHILGIETLASFPDTVSQAFDLFIAAHTNLNSRQLEFLGLLKKFIIEREKVEKRDLIQSPFTIIHPQGIRGVFQPAQIDEILKLTEQLAA